MARYREREEKPDRRPPLTGQELDYLFATLLTDPVLFEQAKFQLDSSYFYEEEEWLRLVWGEVLAFYTRHGRLPSQATIETLLSAILENGAAMTDDDVVAMNQLVGFAFEFAEGFDREFSLGLLRQFLDDRLSYQASQALSGNTPLGVQSMLHNFADKAGAIASLSSSGISRPFDDGWDDAMVALEVESSGFDFIDRYMAGGPAKTESIGFLGPFGGGKTTIATMLTVAAAERSYREWVQGGREGVPACAYHFTYEEPLDGLRVRALSYAARISRSRLTPIIKEKRYDLLSTADSLREEEREFYRELLQQGQRPPGERERYEYAKTFLNACWRPVDMRPCSDNPTRGTGMVDELAALIKQDLAMGESGGVKMVVLDYALAAIERYLEAKGEDRRELRHLVNRMPLQMKMKVAVPFQTVAWTFHQMDTAANAMAGGSVPKANAIAEGKAFPENCDFVFMIGKPSADNLSVLACTKHRRTGPENSSILRLNGAYAKFTDASNQYRIDTKTLRIVSNRDAVTIGVPAEVTEGLQDVAATESPVPAGHGTRIMRRRQLRSGSARTAGDAHE